MKTKLFKRILSIFILTMIASNMFFSTPVSAATDEVKALYEYGNRVQAQYVEASLDIAYHKPVTVYDNPEGGRLVDGRTSINRGFWTSDGIAGNGQVQEVLIDLLGYYYIDTWVVKGASPVNSEPYLSEYRPNAFYFAYEDENGNWIKAQEANGKRNSYFAYMELPRTIIARRVKIVFTEGALYDGKVRVAEIGIYCNGWKGQPGDIMTTRDPALAHSATAVSSLSAVEADGMPFDGKINAVVYTNMDKWYTGYDQVTVLRIKNATWDMAQGAANYCMSKVGCPYNYNYFDYLNTWTFYCNQLSYRCWRENGVRAIYLDSTLTSPPITVTHLRNDDDTYIVYKRDDGIPANNVNW